MLSNTEPPPDSLALDASPILGAAIFDLNGLPKEYYTTTHYQDISWVQTVFQALGLRSLLMASLRLEGFNYSVVHGSEYCAIVVKQHDCYLASILDHEIFGNHGPQIVAWMQQVTPTQFKTSSKFTKV
ncbi:MAG: hypothetical protein F6K16_29900 [Symploca sp. SIO2B6]|nr:hypothetical protein [Symploca sp. SIO2B6]